MDLEWHLEICPPCVAHVNLYKKVTCREFLQELLADYLGGVLSADVVADREWHLEICPPSVAYINTCKKARALVGRAAHVAMPEERAILGSPTPGLLPGWACSSGGALPVGTVTTRIRAGMIRLRESLSSTLTEQRA